MRKFYECKKLLSGDSDGFTRFQAFLYARMCKKWFSEFCLCVCMLYVCTYVRLTRPWMIEQILLIFGISEFIHHRLMHGEYKHSSSKKMDPSDGTHKTTWQFSRKWLWICLNFCNLLRPSLWIKMHRSYLEEHNGHAVRAQTWTVNLTENGCNICSDFIIVPQLGCFSLWSNIIRNTTPVLSLYLALRFITDQWS
jgi:hypothetical protein